MWSLDLLQLADIPAVLITSPAFEACCPATFAVSATLQWYAAAPGPAALRSDCQPLQSSSIMRSSRCASGASRFAGATMAGAPCQHTSPVWPLLQINTSLSMPTSRCALKCRQKPHSSVRALPTCCAALVRGSNATFTRGANHEHYGIHQRIDMRTCAQNCLYLAWSFCRHDARLQQRRRDARNQALSAE